MQVCVETMMHLTCTNMPVSELENALDKVAPCTYSVSCLASPAYSSKRCLLQQWVNAGPPPVLRRPWTKCSE